MRPAHTSASPVRPALLTPAQLAVHAFVAAHPGATVPDLVAAGWGRTGASSRLHALWRAGLLIRGRVRCHGRREPAPPYGYCVSARPVRAEVVDPPEPLRLRAVSVLRERGPLTSRQLAAALGTTPKTIATIGRVHGWPATREQVAGGTMRLRWSA